MGFLGKSAHQSCLQNDESINPMNLEKLENSQSIFWCLISDETHKLSSRKVISLGLDTELSGMECNIPNSIPKVLNFNGVHT